MKKSTFFICVFSTNIYAQYNYTEALQKAIFFFEDQQSGWCPKIIALNGAAQKDDGQDVGLDLSGGWYDAGDHWKANSTMAWIVTTLSWSVLNFPKALERTGQMDKL